MVIRGRKIAFAPNILINMFFIIMSIGFIVPLLALASISVTGEMAIAVDGYRLIPKFIDLSAYRFIFRTPDIIVNSYKTTIIMSGIGTIVSVLMISMCAYPLSRQSFKYRNGITFYLFFTMLFSGGLAPFYIMMTKYLGLKNTYLALILPILGNVWYLLLMRTFFQQVPSSIIESAYIDGASEFKIYLTIIIPLSTPVFATIGLFQLLNYWNSWNQALLFITKPDMYPLQYLLQVMLRNAQEVLNDMRNGMTDLNQNLIPTESVRMGMCLIAVGPMLIIFPFFQKYFTKGLTVGSVKG